jgi:hypothetical protein
MEEGVLDGVLVTIDQLDSALLRVSRGFKEEAEVQTQKTTTLKLTDTGECGIIARQFPERIGTLVMILHLELVASCSGRHCGQGNCGTTEEMGSNQRWVEEVCQKLPQLEQVHAVIDVDWFEEGAPDSWLEAEHEQLFMAALQRFIDIVPRLKSVGVYKVFGRGDKYALNSDAEQQEWGRWAPGIGWNFPIDSARTTSMRQFSSEA